MKDHLYFEIMAETKPVVSNSLISSKENCTYTKCYCEENVWKLCEYLKHHHPTELDHCYSVFISNNERLIPLWQQKSSQRIDTMVIWDYHVIFIYSPPNGDTIVYDLDTTLPFPCDFKTYFLQGIRSNQSLQPKFYRFFRVIPAASFLQTFASDRSHMLNDDGKYMETPPDYPPIKTQDSNHNIDDFISMDEKVGTGTVMSLNDFVNRFHQSPNN